MAQYKYPSGPTTSVRSVPQGATLLVDNSSFMISASSLLPGPKARKGVPSDIIGQLRLP
jgi:hypothetical protein